MQTARFLASVGLPAAPRDTRLRTLRFATCPGSDLTLSVVCDRNEALDERGVPRDAWWCVRCDRLPDRTFRLYDGGRSLEQLLRRYGFYDASGCVHHKDVIAEYRPASEALPPYSLDHIPAPLRDATGVPQYHPRSGVCWFAALCWTTFANPPLRALFERHAPLEVLEHARTCLHAREKAESLRHHLWNTYAVGDDVTQRPEEDGRNGFSEFTVLCAKLGLPLVRYRECEGRLERMGSRVSDRKGGRVDVRGPSHPKEPHLLALRFEDGDHRKFPILRRIQDGKGTSYRLAGMYMGQSKCGHQIGVASSTGDWRDWSFGDADLHKDGCGPIFVRFCGDEWNEQWWESWKWVVHLTKFGAGYERFCNFSPHNPEDEMGKGQNSIDVLYVSE